MYKILIDCCDRGQAVDQRSENVPAIASYLSQLFMEVHQNAVKRKSSRSS